MSTDRRLPFVDTHTVSVALGPDQLWTALHRYAEKLSLPGGRVLPALLGTDPRPGFAVTSEIPGERVVLTGRHRFAEYELMFTIEGRTSQRTTLLHATTHAAFPGLHGRAYRRLVIGTGLHEIATKRMLRAITEAAVSDAD